MRMLEDLDKVSSGIWKGRKIVGAICALLMVTSMSFVFPENAKAQPPIRNPTWSSAALGAPVASLDLANDMAPNNERYIAAGTYHDELHLFRASGDGTPEWSVTLNVAGFSGLQYLADSVSISPDPLIAVGHDHNVSLYDVNGDEVWDEECIDGGYYDVVGTAIDDDATYVAAGGGNTTCLFDAADGTLLSTAFTNNTYEKVAVVDMSQDGQYIAVSSIYSYPGYIMVFENNNGVLEMVMRSAMIDDIVTLDMSDDGDYIVAGEDDSGNRDGSDVRLYHWGDNDAWDWSDGDNYVTDHRENDVYAVAIARQGTRSSAGGTWRNEPGSMYDNTLTEMGHWETSVNWATAVVDHPLGFYAVYGQAMAGGHTWVYFCRSTDLPGECYWRYQSTNYIYDVDAEGYFHVVAGNSGGYVHYWRQNPPPVAEFSWTPPEPLEGEDIQFTDESYDPDGRIVVWEWDFAGLGTSTDQNPIFAFGHAGTYPVILTVEDDEGATDEITHNVVVTNVAPDVEMTATPNPVPEGTDVTFDGFFDDPSWLDEHTAEWDFDDGDTETGYFQPEVGYTHHEMDAVTHAYGKAGMYQVKLTIEDDMGGIGIGYVTVTIINVDPIVTANINTTTIPEGDPFRVNGSFYDPSWDDEHYVLWKFGYFDTMSGRGPDWVGDYTPKQGFTDHEVIPVEWTYGDDGDYEIELVVTDEFGGEDSDSVWIEVQNVPPTLINISSILWQNAQRTHGYWKHQCNVQNPNEDHPGIRQEWIDAIRQQSTVFTDVYTENDVCDFLKPTNPMTPMKKAKMQLMALWLNVVSGLLFIDSPLHHPDAPDDESVREFIEHAEWLILYDPTDENLNWVNDIATDINEDADDQNDWLYTDPLVGDYSAHAIDPGTDDLMFVWDDGLAGTGNIVHYQYNGIDPDPYYNPLMNEIRSPEEDYPFETVDRLIVGYPPGTSPGVTAGLVCLKDDDGGESLQANKDCSDPWGGGGTGQVIAWSFGFTISYRSISGGFVIAEVEAYYTTYDPLVIPVIKGGRLTS